MLFLFFDAFSSEEEGRMRYLFPLQKEKSSHMQLAGFSSTVACNIPSLHPRVTPVEVAHEARVVTEIGVVPGERSSLSRCLFFFLILWYVVIFERDLLL